MKYVEDADYELVRRIFKRSGVPLTSDEFDLVLRPELNTPGRKKSLTRRIPIKK